MRNQEVDNVAKKLIENVITIFGVPMQIHTDQGTNFESNLYKTRTTVMRLQSKGSTYIVLPHRRLRLHRRWLSTITYITLFTPVLYIFSDTDSRKSSPVKPKAPMRQYNVGAPLERIAIDVMSPLPTSTVGNKYILVIGDYFTKCVHAVPTPYHKYLCLTLLRVFFTPKCFPVTLSCNCCKTEAFNLSGITICHVIVWPSGK
jgi:hypothetical protein